MYTSNSKIVRVRRPRFSIRRRRLHWRVRKSIASRRVRLRGLRQFRRLSRPVNIYTRLPKRKRPSLFTYKEPGLGRSSFSSASDSVRLPVWGRAQLFVRRIRRAQRARSKRLSNSLGAPKAIGRKKTNVPLRS
jgi:hypothetical protein